MEVGALGADGWFKLERDAVTALADHNARQALAVICERLEWDVGVLWTPEVERVLVAHTVWTAPEVDAAEFVDATCTARLARGEGEAGGAWATLRPRSRTDFDPPSPFLRAESAARSGMQSAIWIPLKASGDLFGVLELLRRSGEEPMPGLLDRLDGLGEILAICLRGMALQNALIAREQAFRADLERQVAERTRELAATQARLQRFYDSDIIGMFVGSFAGVALEANQEFLRIIGYTQEDVAAGAIRMESVSAPESSDRDAIARKQLLDTGVAAAYEKEFVRKDGSRVPIVLGAARLGDSDSVICFVLDNTRRKQVERDIASLNDRLEDRFLARTAELRASQEETIESERRLRALAQRLMQLREDTGTEIAREIHDGLGSDLTGLKMDISWVLRRLAAASNPHEITDRLSTMIEAVDRLVTSVRRIATDLRPPALDDLGLAAALRWWGEQFAARSGLEVSIDAPDHIVASRGVSTALFRVAQELLTNVARHARAIHVDVSLASLAGTIELRVNDDGVGIDPSAAGASLGLTGIRERVLACSGRFEIGRRDPDRGTLAVVRVPDGQAAATG